MIPLDAALTYARNGWKILPLHSMRGALCSCGKEDCSKPGKHPRIADWSHAASCDLDIVRTWFTQFSDANIGLQLDGLAVLDVDSRHGGLESLADLEAAHRALDRAVMQRTGGDGLHFLFRPEGAEINRGFRPGLDLLTGRGCYIVAEPSIHALGGTYSWAEKFNPLLVARNQIELHPAPQWLLDAARPGKPRPLATGKTVPDVIPEGGRNATLTRLAGTMRRVGMSQDAILAGLRETNREKCNPPLSDGDVETIAKSVARYEPEARATDEGLTPELAKTIKSDTSFARDAGGRLYVFENGVYTPNGRRRVEKRVKALCESLGKTKLWNPELASRVEAWIVTDAPDLWEQPPIDVLNVKNGLLDVRTKELGSHDPEHLSPVQIPVEFDPAAKCPAIEKFVQDCFPSDSHHLAWELAAWLMLPDTSIQKALLALGGGSNGKSVFLNLLQEFIGRDNCSALSLHKIESDKFAAARLCGRLANICPDLPTAALSGTSMFKALTGGDTINAERKFESSFEFRPFARLVFSANSAPRSDDATHGFFRRWLVLPFDRTFSENDPESVPRAVLDARLSEPVELSGLLNKALDALPKIREGRFTESASTRAALDEFRMTTDPFAVWLDANTVERPEAFIRKDELRKAYAHVCQDTGRPIMGDVQFTATLRRLRPRVEPQRKRLGSGQVQVFVGLGWLSQDPEPGSQGSGLF